MAATANEKLRLYFDDYFQLIGPTVKLNYREINEMLPINPFPPETLVKTSHIA